MRRTAGGRARADPEHLRVRARRRRRERPRRLCGEPARQQRRGRQPARRLQRPGVPGDARVGERPGHRLHEPPPDRHVRRPARAVAAGELHPLGEHRPEPVPRGRRFQEFATGDQTYALPEFTNQITIIVDDNVAQEANVNVNTISTRNWAQLREVSRRMMRTEGGRLRADRLRPEDPRVLPTLGEVVRKPEQHHRAERPAAAQHAGCGGGAELRCRSSATTGAGTGSSRSATRSTSSGARTRSSATRSTPVADGELHLQRVRGQLAELPAHGQVLREPPRRPDHDVRGERLSDPGARVTRISRASG